MANSRCCVPGLFGLSSNAVAVASPSSLWSSGSGVRMTLISLTKVSWRGESFLDDLALFVYAVEGFVTFEEGPKEMGFCWAREEAVEG